MAISANAFFHFTSKFDVLISILREGFWPRYCIERGWGNKYIDFALPMVCFCDIPLGQILNHTNTYGEFGIGVSHGWVTHNKLFNPVQYISNNSEIFNKVSRELTKLKNSVDSVDAEFLCRVKKVSGEFRKTDGKNLRVKFYDEREWRYVPQLDNTFGLVSSDKKNPVDINEKSKSTQAEKLKLFACEIRYIILPNEKYRFKMIKCLKELFTESETDLLISKIITLEQIMNDF